jgi:hypothetical protein
LGIVGDPADLIVCEKVMKSGVAIEVRGAFLRCADLHFDAVVPE